MHDSRVDGTRGAGFGRDDGEFEKRDWEEKPALNCRSRSDFRRGWETVATGARSVSCESDGGVDEVAGSDVVILPERVAHADQDRDLLVYRAQRGHATHSARAI